MSLEIAKREQCPKCAEKGKDTDADNLAVYVDGKFCQACGYVEKQNRGLPLLAGHLVEIRDRGLTLKTCEHYNIRSTEFSGTIANHALVKDTVVIFPFYRNGKVVRQKIRSKANKKAQQSRGDANCRTLFGQNCFSPTKMLPIIVTEGEFDAASIYQMSEYKLPAVSIVNGAGSAVKDITENLEWLAQWREVLLCFDNDSAGQEAVAKCLPIFEPGSVKVIRLPTKDANELLLSGKSEEMKKCIYTAEIIRPKTIVFLEDIRDKILTPPKFGSPFPWPFMTKVTYGLRLGEVYVIAADTSIGKTQIVYEILSFNLKNGLKAALFDLERQPEQTCQRIIGAIQNKRIYIPGCEDFIPKDIEAVIAELEGKLALYQPESGKLSIESVLINIRYLNKAYGITFFIIDNLTYLSSSIAKGAKEHEFASHATGKLVQIAKELNINIFIINHLTKSSVQLSADISMGEDFVYDLNKKGLSWESGRMPEINHIYGGGKVAKLPDYLIVCARNRVSNDSVERRTIHLKFLKTRFESSFEGKMFKLLYDPETGKLSEIH